MKNAIFGTVAATTLVLSIETASAAILTFNSADTDIAADRDAWLLAAGVASPQHLVNFETGFTAEQNISGVSGLFPGGMVITDTSAGNALIRTAGQFGGSNPVGNFAVWQNEQADLVLDFALSPVGYVAFRDIDQSSTTVTVTYGGGLTASFLLETTGASGNSAEFAGVVANDITMIQLDANGDSSWGIDNIEYGVAEVPIPASAWLFGSALLGLIGVARRKKV